MRHAAISMLSGFHNIGVRLRQAGCCRWAQVADDDRTSRPIPAGHIRQLRSCAMAGAGGSPWLCTGVDRLGQSVVRAVADAADRQHDPASASRSVYLIERTNVDHQLIRSVM